MARTVVWFLVWVLAVSCSLIGWLIGVTGAAYVALGVALVRLAGRLHRTAAGMRAVG